MFSTLSAVSVVHNIHITLRSVIYLRYGASLVAQTVQRLLTIQETWVWSLGREDSPGEGKWQLTPVFMPGKSHGPGSLVGYSPWGCKELDLTEWLSIPSAGAKKSTCLRVVGEILLRVVEFEGRRESKVFTNFHLPKNFSVHSKQR